MKSSPGSLMFSKQIKNSNCPRRGLMWNPFYLSFTCCHYSFFHCGNFALLCLFYLRQGEGTKVIYDCSATALTNQAGYIVFMWDWFQKRRRWPLLTWACIHYQFFLFSGEPVFLFHLVGQLIDPPLQFSVVVCHNGPVPAQHHRHIYHAVHLLIYCDMLPNISQPQSADPISEDNITLTKSGRELPHLKSRQKPLWNKFSMCVCLKACVTDLSSILRAFSSSLTLHSALEMTSSGTLELLRSSTSRRSSRSWRQERERVASEIFCLLSFWSSDLIFFLNHALSVGTWKYRVRNCSLRNVQQLVLTADLLI